MCAQPPVQALLLLSSFPFISIVFFPIIQQILIIDGTAAPEVSKFLLGGLNCLCIISKVSERSNSHFLNHKDFKYMSKAEDGVNFTIDRPDVLIRNCWRSISTCHSTHFENTEANTMGHLFFQNKSFKKVNIFFVDISIRSNIFVLSNPFKTEYTAIQWFV